MSALLSLVLAMPAMSGCASSSPGKPLTRAQFTAKANAVCRRVVGEVKWSKIDTSKFSPAVANRLAAMEERASAELDKLTPPSSVFIPWRLIVDGFRATGPAMRHEAHVLVIKGARGYPILPVPAEEGERMLQARAIGLRECGQL